MKKMGRPITGQGETLYIPKEILPIVKALKNGDKEKAILLIQNILSVN